MTPLQKTAWIEAGFWIAATLLFLALLYQFGPEKAQAAFALIGLLPFSGYVVHRRSGTAWRRAISSSSSGSWGCSSMPCGPETAFR